MMKYAAVSILTLIQCISVGAVEMRALEDADQMQGYYFKFDKCVRVRIPQENEDDDANVYFYNGAYRSQSQAYASFFRCAQGCDESCDTSVAYVSDLNTALQSSVEYAQGYCYACAQQCGRRRLEDEAAEEEQMQYTVDCNTCTSQCQTYNTGANQGSDETEYLDCQAAFQDGNGVQLYSAPACASNGALVIGLFYDEECTVKNGGDNTGFEHNFAYNSFQTVQGLCMNCDSGLCTGIVEDEDAVTCVDGSAANGENDDMKVCKTYKRFSKEWEYAKKRGKSKMPMIVTALIILLTFLFLAYSYFIRHRSYPASKTALLHDQTETKRPQAELL